MAETYHLIVKNWDKYQKRAKDYVRPVWFSLDNSIYEDPDIYDLSAEEFRAWIYIMCQASKQAKGGKISISEDHANRSGNVDKKALKSLINKFLALRILMKSAASSRPAPDHEAASSRQDADQLPAHTLQNITVQNNTLVPNGTTAELEPEPADRGLSAQRSEKFPIVFNSVEELLAHLPTETLKRWTELYPDKEFLQRETKKAFGYYCHDNPRKKPASRRGWSQALSSWLERGWSKSAKFTKGVDPNSWEAYAARERAKNET